MIRETHQRFIIEPEDKILAEKYNFNNSYINNSYDI